MVCPCRVTIVCLNIVRSYCALLLCIHAVCFQPCTDIVTECCVLGLRFSVAFQSCVLMKCVNVVS